MSSPCASNYFFDSTNLECYSPACPTKYTYTPTHTLQDNDQCQYSGTGTPVPSTTTLTFSPFSCTNRFESVPFNALLYCFGSISFFFQCVLIINKKRKMDRYFLRIGLT